jgi:hypothetical protein
MGSCKHQTEQYFSGKPLKANILKETFFFLETGSEDVKWIEVAERGLTCEF